MTQAASKAQIRLFHVTHPDEWTRRYISEYSAAWRLAPQLRGLSRSGMCPMTATALSTIQPVFTGAERLALDGFLAGYR